MAPIQLHAALILVMPLLAASFSTFIPRCAIYSGTGTSHSHHALTTDKPMRQTPLMMVSSSTSLKYQNESGLQPVEPVVRRRRRSKPSSFAQRMQNVLVDRTKDETLQRQDKDNKNTEHPAPNIKTIHNLNEYKDMLAAEKDKMIIVRWYADWCRACAAVKPRYYRMANAYASREDIVFVEVPVTEKNANLHQGLGVPTLPFGHIYYPGSGLAEELKMVKPHFKKFEKTVQWYASGSCDIPDGESADPFAPQETKEESQKLS
jgi:thiol-disulfide isomerase/thioredoxin